MTIKLRRMDDPELGTVWLEDESGKEVAVIHVDAVGPEAALLLGEVIEAATHAVAHLKNVPEAADTLKAPHVIMTRDGRFLAKDLAMSDDIGKAERYSIGDAQRLVKTHNDKYGAELVALKAKRTTLLDVSTILADEVLPTAVACCFSRILRSWLTVEQMNEIIAKNAEEDGCASHEYCDPNEAMIQAFEHIVGRPIECMLEEDMRLSDEAWDIAKASGFSTYPISGDDNL